MTVTRQKAARSGATPRVKVWLERRGDYVFGYGIASILREVDAAGSIKEAARRLKKSYRYVWARIKEAEAALGEPLVDSRVGGAGPQRTELTPLGRSLTRSFLSFRARMHKLLDREYRRCFS
ncbi:MAG: LysR family transcriptional regulator [Planctomycetia bacterium]|nr:LysR family transcriptional regulator [Planctomycetia bacterium]